MPNPFLGKSAEVPVIPSENPYGSFMNEEGPIGPIPKVLLEADEQVIRAMRHGEAVPQPAQIGHRTDDFRVKRSDGHEDRHDQLLKNTLPEHDGNAD